MVYISDLKSLGTGSSYQLQVTVNESKPDPEDKEASVFHAELP